MDLELARRIASIRGVPPRVLAAAGVASVALLVIAALHGWPAWRAAVPIVLLWVPILVMETAWTGRHYGWLALFFGLVVWQGGHVIEHVAQMVQLHVLGFRGPQARGIFGALDVEWVHFVFNTTILLAVAALLTRYRRNPWLWVTLAVAGWHQAEHSYIMAHYLGSGATGHPGLLARDGFIGGGVGIVRPDLHFFYNLIETLPLGAGFVWQIKRSHDAWLARAFPRLPEQTLVRITTRARPRIEPAGAIIVREGDLGDGFFVIARGSVAVTRAGPLGEVFVAALGPGRFFGESALLHDVPRTASVRAIDPVELLELNRADFRALVGELPELAAEVSAVARQRLAPA